MPYLRLPAYFGSLKFYPAHYPMDNRLLLIVDPQIDFISGSLAVPGAAEAFDSLAEYLTSHPSRYQHTIVTADHHPANHCSFISNGGQWPVHCAAGSRGAEIRESLRNALALMPGGWTLLHKGLNPDTEESSSFKNKVSAEILLAIIQHLKINTIDICGVAGDYCVADTIRDALTQLPAGVQINILIRFTPSIDGGCTLNTLITENNLNHHD